MAVLVEMGRRKKGEGEEEEEEEEKTLLLIQFLLRGLNMNFFFTFFPSVVVDTRASPVYLTGFSRLPD